MGLSRTPRGGRVSPAKTSHLLLVCCSLSWKKHFKSRAFCAVCVWRFVHILFQCPGISFFLLIVQVKVQGPRTKFIIPCFLQMADCIPSSNFFLCFHSLFCSAISPCCACQRARAPACVLVRAGSICGLLAPQTATRVSCMSESVGGFRSHAAKGGKHLPCKPLAPRHEAAN